MKKIILIITMLLFVSSSAMAAGTTEANVKLYKVYLSLNGDCSSPITAWDVANHTDDYPLGYAEVDMVVGPEIGTMTVNETGTGESYKCIIFKMSDKITFIPDADVSLDDVVVCNSEITEPYAIDVCYDYGGESGAPTVTNPETGDTYSCSLTEDMIYLYVSTYSAASEGSQDQNPFAPPTSDGDAVNGFALTSGAFEVTADGSILTFIFGTDGKVNAREDEGGAVCEMEAPDFGATVTAP